MANVPDTALSVSIVDEMCSTCGEGSLLSSGVYANADGRRVRWAMWTCGHQWRSDGADERRSRTTTNLAGRVLAAAGFRRHATSH